MVLLHFYLMYTNCTCTIYIWCWPDNQFHCFNKLQDLWVEKYHLTPLPHSTTGKTNEPLEASEWPFIFNWFLKSHSLKLCIGSLTFSCILMVKGTLGKYNKYNPLSHLLFLSSSSSWLRSHRWEVIPKTGRANKMANSANLDLGYVSCFGSTMPYRAVLMRSFTKAKELACKEDLFHVVTGGIQNWIVKLLMSAKVSLNQVHDCISALSYLGVVKALVSFKNWTCYSACKQNLFIPANSSHIAYANTGIGTEDFLPQNKTISPFSVTLVLQE